MKLTAPLLLAFSFAILVACGDDSSGGFTRMPERTSNDTSENTPPEAGVLTPVQGASCSNGVKDGDESDVDCGGATCPACANGDACATGTDCASRVCTGTKCTNDAGCADGTREGFAAATFSNIAACAGAWALPGLVTTTAPACDHLAGNDSANATGAGCNVADLCQAGWHVCTTAVEVKAKSNDAGCAAAGITGSASFFVARQSGSGGAACGTGTNDLFGCGDVGNAPDVATCGPFDRFSFDLCTALPTTWSCGTDGAAEANNVTKTASTGGGVLCCRD